MLCYLNMAACNVKLEQWTAVVNNSDMALLIHRGHPKALLRRGKAYLELGREEDGRRDLHAVQLKGGAEGLEAGKVLLAFEKRRRARTQTAKAIAPRPTPDTAVAYDPSAGTLASHVRSHWPSLKIVDDVECGRSLVTGEAIAAHTTVLAEVPAACCSADLETCTACLEPHPFEECLNWETAYAPWGGPRLAALAREAAGRGLYGPFCFLLAYCTGPDNGPGGRLAPVADLCAHEGVNVAWLCDRLRGVLSESQASQSRGLPTQQQLETVVRAYAANHVRVGGLSLVAYALALVNHDCAPNCELSVEPRPPYTCRVRSLRRIDPDEAIRISYAGLEPGASLWGRPKRRDYLRNRWGFACACAQCRGGVEPARLYACPSCGPDRGWVFGGADQDGSVRDPHGRRPWVCTACRYKLDAEEREECEAAEAAAAELVALEPAQWPAPGLEPLHPAHPQLLQLRRSAGSPQLLLECLRWTVCFEGIVHGPATVVVAECCSAKAQLLEDIGKYREARVAYDEAVGVWGKARGAQSDDAQRAREALAGFDRRRGEVVSA